MALGLRETNKYTYHLCIIIITSAKLRKETIITTQLYVPNICCILTEVDSSAMPFSPPHPHAHETKKNNTTTQTHPPNTHANYLFLPCYYTKVSWLSHC